MAIITERVGDIFSAPPNSILIHACNARGTWGAGVALAFKKRYPAAYSIYHTHCTTLPHPTNPPSTKVPRAKARLAAHQASLVGTTLLIPPSEVGAGGKGHWIACLFTSAGYGRGVAGPEAVLGNTRLAVEDLGRRVQEGEGMGMGECWAVRINSGLFGVPWGDTRRVLEGGEVDMCVVGPAGEGEGEDEGESRGEVRGEVGDLGKGNGVRRGKKAGEKGVKKRSAPVHVGLEERRQKRLLKGWLKP